MRTELEPYLGQYIYFQATVSTWKDGVLRLGPTSDQEKVDVVDVCLKNVKWSLFDLDATGVENNDAFFDSDNRSDHFWVRVPPYWLKDVTRLESKAMVGLVTYYRRKDGTEDFGVQPVTMLRAGDAYDTITKHFLHYAYGPAYELCMDVIQTAEVGAGVLIAPNASHNKILKDFIDVKDRLKPRLQEQHRKQAAKARRKPKIKLAKGFA